MKNLKDIILEKLNYSSIITNKICKAFGLDKKDELTDAIDIWVYDNNVKNVIFYCNNIQNLNNMNIPKSIIKLYKDDQHDLENINKILKKSKTIASDNKELKLIATSQVLALISSSEDKLYAYAK